MGHVPRPQLRLWPSLLSCRTMSSSVSRGLLLLAGLCSLVSGSQAEDPEEMDTSVHDHDHHKYIVCHNILYNAIDFAFDLYQEPASWSKTTNVLLSPISIVAAFAMLSLGTKGDTQMQILEGLKLNLREMPEAHIHQCFQLLLHIFQHPDHQLRLTIGSSLFVSDSLVLVDRFVQDVKELYHSEVISVSFRDTKRARKQINHHVERETHGEIVDLVKDLEEDTDLTLVNYISFHGKERPPSLGGFCKIIQHAFRYPPLILSLTAQCGTGQGIPTWAL